MTVRSVLSLCAAAAALCGGCGAVTAPDFPRRLTGADGQHFVVEDLRSIADDPDLSDDQKRRALRDLGIEDEKLISALLEL